MRPASSNGSVRRHQEYMEIQSQLQSRVIGLSQSRSLLESVGSSHREISGNASVDYS
jgi:hypothetical protein